MPAVPPEAGASDQRDLPARWRAARRRSRRTHKSAYACGVCTSTPFGCRSILRGVCWAASLPQTASGGTRCDRFRGGTAQSVLSSKQRLVGGPARGPAPVRAPVAALRPRPGEAPVLYAWRSTGRAGLTTSEHARHRSAHLGSVPRNRRSEERSHLAARLRVGRRGSQSGRLSSENDASALRGRPHAAWRTQSRQGTRPGGRGAHPAAARSGVPSSTGTNKPTGMVGVKSA